MKIKAGLFIVLILICIGACALAFVRTGNPGDTPAGSLLIFNGAKNTVDYINQNGTSEPTAHGGTIEATALSEAGFSLSAIPDWSSSQPSTPGVPVTWNVTVLNEGNTPFTFNVTKSSISYSGGSSNWTTTFFEGGSYKSSISKVIADNGSLSFSFTITPSAVESQSPDGSSGSVDVSESAAGFTTPGLPYYVGVNGLTYGDFTSGGATNTVYILAPVMALNRTQHIDAPIIYTGGRHDAVPGAVITYTIAYNNTGAASALGVIIVDKVPDNTEGYHINKTGPQTNVTIEASQGNAAGWGVFYSTSESPSSFAYGNYANWEFLGALSVGNETYNLPKNATYVKWEKASVPAHENANLTWGVTIK